MTGDEKALALLFQEAQYAVNRLDASNSQPQVACDLAVALAVARSYSTLPPTIKNKFYSA